MSHDAVEFALCSEGPRLLVNNVHTRANFWIEYPMENDMIVFICTLFHHISILNLLGIRLSDLYHRYTPVDLRSTTVVHCQKVSD